MGMANEVVTPLVSLPLMSKDAATNGGSWFHTDSEYFFGCTMYFDLRPICVDWEYSSEKTNIDLVT
jgi:hypothetical protein